MTGPNLPSLGGAVGDILRVTRDGRGDRAADRAARRHDLQSLYSAPRTAGDDLL